MTENKELIDDAFYVGQARSGLWKSFDLDHKEMIAALTKEHVISCTRWRLKCIQDGTWNDKARVVNDGFVGGKL
ncbi:hypothetical protein SSZBM1_169 [Synechococcus phage S-SZBM1]|uniref:Uncharacterized protein n=1 Tax=Synechococcus phage S-SZBM1 TaxID=2926475 RepID=A0AC61TSU1_9CAUD|nr:hypothetical protein PP650_gp107 [Synechococcus phage S-SZBM1]UNH61286.1 hypothetical protein SSZBM1_169 [Synechococcus phage S-SZBM1]